MITSADQQLPFTYQHLGPPQKHLAKIVTRTHKGESQSHVEFKFHPKQPALDKLYSYFGLNAQDHLLEVFVEGIPAEGKFSRDDLKQLILQALTPKSRSRAEMIPDPIHTTNCDDAIQEANS